jgi:hypothetical protein
MIAYGSIFMLTAVGYLQAVLPVTASVLSTQWFLNKALNPSISEHAELESVYEAVHQHTT